MKSVKIIYKYWGLTDYDFLQDKRRYTLIIQQKIYGTI